MDEFILYEDALGSALLSVSKQCLFCEAAGVRCVYCGTYSCEECPHVCRIYGKDEEERRLPDLSQINDTAPQLMLQHSGWYTLDKKQKCTTFTFVDTLYAPQQVVRLLVYEESGRVNLISTAESTTTMVMLRARSLEIKYRHPSTRLVYSFPLPLLNVPSIKWSKKVPKCSVEAGLHLFGELYIVGDYYTNTLREWWVPLVKQRVSSVLGSVLAFGCIEVEVLDKENTVVIRGLRGERCYHLKRGICSGIVVRGDVITPFSCRKGTEMILGQAIVIKGKRRYVGVKRWGVYLFLAFVVTLIVLLVGGLCFVTARIVYW